jgi:ADP-dependent NAD(P)H-hydrate dehydratase / NAD(P)H-hydrate epimerase
MAAQPEIICRPVRDPAEISDLLETVDGVVVGPGLGRGDWSRALWQAVLAAPEKPLVVDADGLNLLAEAPRPRAPWVLTPHPGEAGRLLGSSAGDVQRARLDAATELARRFDAEIVLKGAHTLVTGAADPAAVYVCDRGNPGMATAGMGDVLSGVLGGILVQCRKLPLSVRAAVLLHGLAGDDAAAAGERGTVATDLLPQIRRWANPS